MQAAVREAREREQEQEQDAVHHDRGPGPGDRRNSCMTGASLTLEESADSTCLSSTSNCGSRQIVPGVSQELGKAFPSERRRHRWQGS